MTADHHDRELWERYFKPCKNTKLQSLMYRKGLHSYSRSIGLMTLQSIFGVNP